ncbi:tRNA lysidine(34) synthetase TilS [Arsenicicoccus piscis]|uniref:tRNA lysidine(34) synthetase TilS n=1 Tax=Arsenicicoccus piscis TaxID=673954 RepID=UPI001F4CD5A4|nr:tRNA lysidine(34) synthetase TilS [Arsenicicoccus piscis]MCH8627644.1 tRNA lysidine(34) synthetase TilS [Arsenicicoccus piscis]
MEGTPTGARLPRRWGRPPAPVARVRLGVRAVLDALPPGPVLVACSGGADSLALAAAVAFECAGSGRPAGAVVVDHDLQPGSAAVAARTADTCRTIGLDPVLVRRVRVGDDGAGSAPGGPEAAARAARYTALEAAATETQAVAVLLGHTRDDQAEQVLLGLARGSGARSLAGMPRARGVYHRPLLAVGRADTAAACAHDGLVPWADPHNTDPTYARVRARRLLVDLERELGPGVVEALARSADQLRDDADALDAWATDWLAARAATDPRPGAPLDVAALAALPRAVRTRVLRLAALRVAPGAGAPAAGAPTAGAPSATQVAAMDRLVTGYHGQGPVALPGGVRVARVRAGTPGIVFTRVDPPQ